MRSTADCSKNIMKLGILESKWPSKEDSIFGIEIS